MLFGKSRPDSYEVVQEGEENVMRINCENVDYTPSLEDDPQAMQRTVDKLVESGNVTKIVLYQKRDYEYDYSQTMLLLEIANLYKKFAKQKDMFSYRALLFDRSCAALANEWYTEVQRILHDLLRSDPLGAYV